MKNTIKVFIDGSSGTTGLRIYDRLTKRDEFELIVLSDEKRKDKKARSEMLNNCDVALLCLPDEASREAVSMITNPDVRVIDTSTAHRTNSDWVYGMPEFSKEHTKLIAQSKRISVPGCHPTGVITLLRPLIEQNIIEKSAMLNCFSLTGYSGGGKSMIAEYNDSTRTDIYDAPRLYGISQMHKHLPEIVSYTHLEVEPVFAPIVADYYSGMLVMIPLHQAQLKANTKLEDVIKIYKNYYSGQLITYQDQMDIDSFINSNKLSGFDNMHINVSGNDERMILLAAFDNLGKGASGAAIQCLNLVCGLDEKQGLDIL
ncbi:MAG: N-acetyl-gamma-glutamyl-phosphate reductase [Clostridiaceae bacterium]|nr:N-acetyl-gamma-glutamyl-phosphate reductase [Clostridiaceae bacterium]